MARRSNLPTGALAAAAAAKAGSTVDSDAVKTTGVSLPSWALSLLMRVATSRKINRVAGVPTSASVSGILLELIEKNRAELESEVQ